MSTTIQIHNLTKAFLAPSGGTTTAVDHASLTINPGELFFLLGPSGCGKTTLLRMIAGFIDPTSGTITFQDAKGTRDVTHLAPNLRNTGMVFQSYALWPHMTVEANVAFGLNIRKTPSDEKKQRVAEALRAVQMDHYATRKPNQLSGGQQQRVALARALVIRPSVLLLDEPLSNLDAKLRNDLRAEIRKICKASGITTVYVTHDQKEALSMADRIAVMRSGSIVQIGSPTDMYRKPASRFVAEFLGETNLLAATIAEVKPANATSPRLVRLTTPAGELLSTHTEHAQSPGTQVTLSIRPETIQLTRNTHAPSSTNSLKAIIEDTTFLGETAQHTAALADGTHLRLATLHPLATAQLDKGQPTTLTINPDDVVVLPQDAN